MPANFIPLTLKAGSASSAADGKQPGFQPLPNPSQPPESTSTSAVAVQRSGCAAEPSISFEREGPLITRIRVKCVCGQVLELACDYEPDAQGSC
ncbi:MAG: hypothetical protein AB9869_36410 [Verrucomicrobiia bacterium]